LKLAEAAVQLETAVMLVEQTIERNTALMEAGAEITAEQVAWTRRNSCYATLLSRIIVSNVFEIAGGSALYAGHPLQDIFRDTMAGTSHLSLTWHRTAPAYSQIRLGLPVDFDTL
jgi:alkylation response protein AidB-like acyl-CoA dehydrogenase